MSQIRITNYTFNKTARTVTFNDYKTINLDGILLITDETSNVIIYIFPNSNSGGTVLGNVLTLDYNTSAMSNSDNLQIYYDDYYTTSATSESTILLRRTVEILDASAQVDRNNRQRITLDAVKLDTSGNTAENPGGLLIGAPITWNAAGGYQAGAGYGQPVSGTNISSYNDSGYTWSGWDDQLSAYTISTYYDSGYTWIQSQGTPYLTNQLAESWYQMTWEGPVDQRWRVAEDSHLTYQKRIRDKLTFI